MSRLKSVVTLLLCVFLVRLIRVLSEEPREIVLEASPDKIKGEHTFAAVGEVLEKIVKYTPTSDIKRTIQYGWGRGDPDSNFWGVGQCLAHLTIDDCRRCLKYLNDNIWQRGQNALRIKYAIEGCAIRYSNYQINSLNIPGFPNFENYSQSTDVPEFTNFEDYSQSTDIPPKIVCYFQPPSTVNTSIYNIAKIPGRLCTHVIYEFLYNETNIDYESYLQPLHDLKKSKPDMKILLGIKRQYLPDQEEIQDQGERKKFVKKIGNVLRNKTSNLVNGIDFYWLCPRDHSESEGLTDLVRDMKMSNETRDFLLTLSIGMHCPFIKYLEFEIIKRADQVHVMGHIEPSEYPVRKTEIHSPLFNLDPRDEDKRDKDVQKGLKGWTNTPGINRTKIILGVELLGYQYTLVNKSEHGIHSPASFYEHVSYRDICQKLPPHGNWTRVFDNNTQCPYIYYNRHWIGYEDEESLRVKTRLIKQQGIGGVMLYSIDQDDYDGFCGQPYPLLNFVHDQFYPNNSYWIVIGVVVAIVILVIVVFAGLCRHFKINVLSATTFYRKTNVYVERKDAASVCDNIHLLVRDLLYDNKVIRREDIFLGEKLGVGHYGSVFKADFKEEIVAVKTLHPEIYQLTERNIKMFIDEALVMKDFNHPHVLHLIGISFENNLPLVVLPLMENGCLLGYLRNENNTVTIKNLLRFAKEIASGMSYLAEQRFVHRDLAARNCMLDANLLVKVADFGLTRDVYLDPKEEYIQNELKEVPIKWMAPESLVISEYTTKSDVWSFGVVLWELMTRGHVPYGDLPLSCFHHLEMLGRGDRLPQPYYCPREIYQIMSSCWEWEKGARPNFGDIISEIEDFEMRSSVMETPIYKNLSYAITGN